MDKYAWENEGGTMQFATDPTHRMTAVEAADYCRLFWKDVVVISDTHIRLTGFRDYYAVGQPRPGDERFGSDDKPLTRGRCDTCGAPCDDAGCTSSRSHEVAKG